MAANLILFLLFLLENSRCIGKWVYLHIFLPIIQRGTTFKIPVRFPGGVGPPEMGLPELQIRKDIEDNSKIFFLISQQKHIM